MLEYNITLTNNVTKKLKALGTPNWSKPLKQSAAYMERITLTRFAKEIDPDGKQWTPLKPETIKRKKSGVILREKSILINATSSRIVGDTAYIENPTSYGIFHQRGTQTLPRRQFLGFGRRDIARINQFFREYVESL